MPLVSETNVPPYHQLGHLLTDGKVKIVVTKQYHVLLSATDTNVSSTFGSSVL